MPSRERCQMTPSSSVLAEPLARRLAKRLLRTEQVGTPEDRLVEAPPALARDHVDGRCPIVCQFGKQRLAALPYRVLGRRERPFPTVTGISLGIRQSYRSQTPWWQWG
jgi:hypothetical protein